jgi:putative GTP pyrophosphokinase
MKVDESKIPSETKAYIEELVNHYRAHMATYRRFLGALHSQMTDAIDPDKDHPLAQLIHSVKFRLKDPDHLRKKLYRKYFEYLEKNEPFPYTKETLFIQVGDLAGYRILHLHTRQFQLIHEHLKPILEEAHKISEGPIARTWDEETKEYYRTIGIESEHNKRMYSSVHYLVQPSIKTVLTIEIQVRTLADEIWGEIDHKINYPDKHELLACREQILALARITSSCSRSVDAVMATHYEWDQQRLSKETP